MGTGGLRETSLPSSQLGCKHKTAVERTYFFKVQTAVNQSLGQCRSALSTHLSQTPGSQDGCRKDEPCAMSVKGRGHRCMHAGGLRAAEQSLYT